MVAAKSFNDHYYNNATWARVGGIGTQEVNTLEAEFLFVMGFNVNVSRDDFQKYEFELCKHMSVNGASYNPKAAPVEPPIQQQNTYNNNNIRFANQAAPMDMDDEDNESMQMDVEMVGADHQTNQAMNDMHDSMLKFSFDDTDALLYGNNYALGRRGRTPRHKNSQSQSQNSFRKSSTSQNSFRKNSTSDQFSFNRRRSLSFTEGCPFSPSHSGFASSLSVDRSQLGRRSSVARSPGLGKSRPQRYRRSFSGKSKGDDR